MKRIIVLLMTVVLLGGLLLSTACNGADIPNGEGVPDPGEDINMAYPESVQAAVEMLEPLEAGLVLKEGPETYIIVSYSEKPTAGYEVALEFEERNGGLLVRSELVAPDPDTAVAQVISHPYAVEVFEEEFAHVQFQDHRGEYFPQVVGVKEAAPIKKGSDNILVLRNEGEANRVNIAGLARVFEATVTYEVQDQSGNALKKDFVTAASGGPDWGYFEIVEENLPAGASQVEIFQISAKDGSKQDVVLLEI